eukprot:COSAG04_NODE_14502_length_565_cov_0.946352_1_plen_38_part_01
MPTEEPLACYAQCRSTSTSTVYARARAAAEGKKAVDAE